MCVNKSWVLNKYNGKKYFVKCGHCPACQQEKAIKRTNRIKAAQKDIGAPYDELFITLTYDNKFIPYISRFQVTAFLSGFQDSLNIYRDFTARKVSDFKGRIVRQIKKGCFTLDSFKPELTCSRESLLSPKIPLRGIQTKMSKDSFVQDINKIGVVYLPDIQNFIKRLRINLFRKYGYTEELIYFYVCELGAESLRPHFHLLVFVKPGWFNVTSQCVRESWPFGRFFPKSIQRAINAASYVSSYVNCSSTIPDFFHKIKQFRPFHHYSKNFGFGKSDYSLRSVYEMFKRNDFGITCESNKDGVLTRTVVPVPLYVVNKYFRKFKGFSRLTSDEIYSIAQCPCIIGKFRERIEAEDIELRRIYIALTNLQEQYLDYFKDDESILPFGYVYSRIWFAYNAYKLKLSHQNCLCDTDVLQLYDNLRECFYFQENGKDVGYIRNENIKRIVYGSINYFPFVSDPNLYPINVAKNSVLTEYYDKYDKYKRKLNLVYQQYNM